MTGAERLEFTKLVDTARQYCQLIDRVAAGKVWLAPVFQILPRLHARVVALGDPGGDFFPAESPDFDERFELYTRLRAKLGDQDLYWLEFDDPNEADSCEEHRTGSLADDLTDIYFELRRGLSLLDRSGPDYVAHFWEFGFQRHWGQHLVDAERHLYTLRVNNALH